MYISKKRKYSNKPTNKEPYRLSSKIINFYDKQRGRNKEKKEKIETNSLVQSFITCTWKKEKFRQTY